VTRRMFLNGTAGAVAAGVLGAGCSSQSSTVAPAALVVESVGPADAALDRALTRLVQEPDGPPGAIALVQRGSQRLLHRAGVADLNGEIPIQAADSMRLASVAKAFSGAVALSAAADGALSLSDTIGKWLPNLPRAWSRVTLRDVLNHTSGIADFSQTDAFRQDLLKSLLKAPPPQKLLSYAGTCLDFTPGSMYDYSNSDNIVVGLMVQAATGKSYEAELAERVYGPLGLRRTSLPNGAMVPAPLIHGYSPDPPKAPEDVTEVIAAGWSWASGGIVSTPDDANAFIRAYARGAGTSSALYKEQFTFRSGRSEPPGPGTNSAGLAIFRYQTKFGTVYGHTGNTLGYTQFIAATADGSRSVVVSVNAQITPDVNQDRFADLQQIYLLAVGAALANG
jgi:D-alanyl-D-alanine carboxypeptidase